MAQRTDRTTRRQQVAKLRQQGMSNRKIADQLGVDEITVRRDLKNSGQFTEKPTRHKVMAVPDTDAMPEFRHYRPSNHCRNQARDRWGIEPHNFASFWADEYAPTQDQARRASHMDHERAFLDWMRTNG